MFRQRSMAQRLAVLCALHHAVRGAASVFAEGSFLWASRASRLAAITGSSSAIPASNQSALLLSLFPKVSRAVWHIVTLTNVVLLHRGTLCETVLQSFIHGFGEAFPQLRLRSLGCVYAGLGLLLGAVDFLG